MNAMLTRDELALALGRAGEGDRSAFKIVYEATSAKLLGVCLRILADRQLAEDVLQDTYLTVWRKASTFDATRASPITWLVTIARNRSIDRLRSASPMRRSVPVEDAHGRRRPAERLSGNPGGQGPHGDPHGLPRRRHL
jgi:DNA-directed RNA polymerase specialized sigma24 family protein